MAGVSDITNPITTSGTSSSQGSGMTDPFSGSGLPSWFPSSNSLFSELEQQYNTASKAFDTTQFDTAEAQQEGYVTTTASQAADAAKAAYAAKARQEGGSGEGAGLVGAEAKVAGQGTVASMKLAAAQYDITQREGAANLEATIAANLGHLRASYLSSLATYKGDELKAQTSLEVAQLQSQTEKFIEQEKLNEQNYEFQNAPHTVSPGQSIWTVNGLQRFGTSGSPQSSNPWWFLENQPSPSASAYKISPGW